MRPGNIEGLLKLEGRTGQDALADNFIGLLIRNAFLTYSPCGTLNEILHRVQGPAAGQGGTYQKHSPI